MEGEGGTQGKRSNSEAWLAASEWMDTKGKIDKSVCVSVCITGLRKWSCAPSKEFGAERDGAA